jgi:hypothetical protein
MLFWPKKEAMQRHAPKAASVKRTNFSKLLRFPLMQLLYQLRFVAHSV